MAGDGVAAVRLDVSQHPLEPLVGEGLDLPAVVADEVMVVLDRPSDGLEPRDAVAEVDPLHEPLVGEDLEHAVDARQANALAARAERPVDLLRADAALLSVEVVDDAPAGRPAPVPG